MAYRYDIFISYKRQPEARQWITDHLQPLLEHAVSLELGRVPSIYRDDRIETGVAWPAELGLALGDSRVLLALWTKLYFHSSWCSLELATILAREQETSRGGPLKPRGIVIPLILHDCETLPAPLGATQATQLRDLFNTRMQRDSARAERLADEIAHLAPGIARAIEEAPPWRKAWSQQAAQQFLQALHRGHSSGQRTVPGFGR